jgi:protein-arginine kinase activator protein McsA
MKLIYYKKRWQKMEEKYRNFCYHIKLEIYENDFRRYFMAKELTCPICDAEIPLDGDETSGDLVLCSYCNMTFKMVKTMEDWTLTEDFEE